MSCILFLAIFFRRKWGSYSASCFPELLQLSPFLGIVENSDGFQSASKKLTDGTLIIKILSNVIIIPILEELLYRGIIAGQVCLWYGWIAATIFSSFCFGISHFNIVQFLYALIVGIALGTLYCKTKRLSLCILAHGITNLIVILFS